MLYKRQRTIVITAVAVHNGPPPHLEGREGGRGQMPSDSAGGSPPTARVRNHGIGVAIDGFPHK